MDQKHIVSEGAGELYLKLSERTANQIFTQTLAAISCEDVVISHVITRKGIDTEDITISLEEAKILAEGIHQVIEFWEKSPIPKGQVLLECGCLADWGEEKASPCKGAWGWCGLEGDSDHEDQRVYRFNKEDWK